MPTTLPSIQQRFDTAFTTTWYKIRPKAADNIMTATNIWSLFQEKGRLKGQTGGTTIDRPIDYALPDTQEFQKGVQFATGVGESRTMARWNFKYVGINIQRDVISDVENSGEFKIIDYVQDRLMKARKALKLKFESILFNATNTSESGVSWQGLNDIVPLYANATTGTYGGIARPSAYVAESTTSPTLVPDPAGTNSWWGPKYLLGTTPAEVNFEQDLTVLYNSIQNNQENPDIIICDKWLIEIYEQFAVDKTQILVKESSSPSVQLGFVQFRFKGASMTWTSKITPKNALILTSSSMEIVYRTNLWFEMTRWKEVPLGLDAFAQILCSGNIICEEPRRNGRLYYA